MKNFENKVAAITGAGSGIGRALALELASRGCHLALADLSAEGLAETAELLKAHPVQVTTQVLDAGDREAVEAWARLTCKNHGQVNMVFNNAGVALSGTVAGLSIEEYEWVMQVNFWGVVYGTKAFLPFLEKSGAGHIVNISSVFGLTAQPLMSGYNASKYAVRGFTESLRQDLELSGSCVSATCVHPGGIKTNIAKTARQGESVTELTGMDSATASKEFERSFITTAEQAARTILRGVERDRRRVLIGPDARFLDILVRILPAFYQRVFVWAVRAKRKKFQAATA